MTDEVGLCMDHDDTISKISKIYFAATDLKSIDLSTSLRDLRLIGGAVAD